MGSTARMAISSKHPLALPTLVSVVFCPGPLRYLNLESPSEETLSGIFTEDLPPGRRPEPDDFSSFLVKSGISFQDVPTLFGSSPAQTNLAWSGHSHSSELENCLQYVFSDGLVITAREILYHPYALRIPAPLLPLLSQVHSLMSQSPWLHLFPESRVTSWGNLKSAEQCLLSILFETQAAAKKRTPEDPLHLWITPTRDADVPRRACSIRQFDVLLELKSRWTIEPTELGTPDQGGTLLSFRQIPSKADGIILENFEISPEKGTLVFHPYRKCLEIVLSQMIGRDAFIWPKTPQLPLSFEIQGHQKIQKIVQEIDEKLSQKDYPLIVHAARTILPSSQITPFVHVEKSGRFLFVREFELAGQKSQVWNLPAIAQTFVQGLEGGIGSTTGRDHRLYAQDRKGQRRDRDLKILKHSGSFALILLETLSFALRKKSFEGKPLANTTDFFSLLFERLGVLLFEIEKKAGFFELSPAPPLDRLCSKNVIDLIKRTVTSWFELKEKDQESVFTAHGEICLQGGALVSFHLFDELLSTIAVKSRGQCFLKLRAGVFPAFTGEEGFSDLQMISLTSDATSPHPVALAQSYSPLGPWLNHQQTLHTLLPLRQAKIQLSYDGLPLSEMDIQDFKPEFNLVENPENPANSAEIDWFELHPKFFFKGQEIGSQGLERLSREGVLEFQGKIYLIQNKNLPNVKRLEAFWSKIQGTQSLAPRRRTQDTFLHIPKSQTLEMLALRATGVSVTGGKRWEEICRFYDSLSQQREPLQIPTSLRAELKPYQKSGVRWLIDLYELGLGGILADDMGLGKTIQTLAFLDCLRAENKMGSALIVVPTSLTYNWMSEAARFTPEIPFKTFQSKSKSDIAEFISKNQQFAMVCTYGLFTEHQEFFEKQKWNILVFDEAQNLKNITSKRTTASRSVSARFKICLTGTPLENHLGEFYSLLDLAVSGSLGDLSEFRDKFVNPDTLDAAEIKYLKLKAKPLILRRTKAEILKELPPKVESTIKLPFEQKQEKIYRDIALSWNEKVKGAILNDGEARSQILMLTALLRLRQACSDPGSIPNIKYVEQPPKLGVLLEALHEVTESGESALVFTQFLHTFDRIKKSLTQNKIPFFSLHGGTSRPERERILKEFQLFPKGSVLLMTLKTGGVGLNLVKASYVFHLEPWWNPAVENQATDRAHRIGQQKAVQVYRYLMKESVEEKIEILKERKSARFNALFSSTENDNDINLSDSRLTQADFEYLLG